jgi:ProP effector
MGLSHCNNPRYLMSMVEGATRIDLQGQPAGVVTAEEAARAQQRLAERLKRAPPQSSPKAPPQASSKAKAESFGKPSQPGKKAVVVEVRRKPSWKRGSNPKRTFNV